MTGFEEVQYKNKATGLFATVLLMTYLASFLMSLFLFYYIISQGVSGAGGLGNGLLLPGIERGNSMV